jgi:hypothetical protein
MMRHVDRMIDVAGEKLVRREMVRAAKFEIIGAHSNFI